MPRKKNKRLRRSPSLARPHNPDSMLSQSYCLPSLSKETDPKYLLHEDDEGKEAVEDPGPKGDEENAELEREPEAGSDSEPYPVIPAEESRSILEVQDGNPNAAQCSSPSPLLSRKGNRKRPSRKQRVAVEKKLRLLGQNLRLAPFEPSTTLEFGKHEGFLRALGLWDFVLLDLGAEVPRRDLLSALIANYDAGCHCSYVLDQRINITRADLGRALLLPTRREQQDSRAFDLSPGEEQLSFLSLFLQNYLLLHDDAAWIMPEKVIAWERLVREGQFHKVDWAGMIWFMVERELVEAPESGNCYYAAHLQRLIRSQKPDLFKEEEVKEVSVEMDEEVSIAKNDNLDEPREYCEENRQSAIEMQLGQDTGQSDRPAEVAVMDVQECGKEELGQWFLSDGGIETDHSLRHCDLGLGNSECEMVDKDIAEEGNGLPLKIPDLERLHSTELGQEMETETVPCEVPANMIGPSSVFLSEEGDLQKNLLLNEGSLPIFRNSSKGDINGVQVQQDTPHFDQDGKMKADGAWDSSTEDIGMCLEQAMSWINRAQVTYEEEKGEEDRGEEYTRAQMNVDYLAAQLQQRDNLINSIEKSALEERNRKQLEFYRLQGELRILTQLVYGYKKALKETRKAFAEYKKQSQHLHEPILEGVGGNGGVVLSIMDVEQQRLRKEDEKKMCYGIEEKVKALERCWLGKFDSYRDKVDLLARKLLKMAEAVEFLRSNSKAKHLTA